MRASGSQQNVNLQWNYMKEIKSTYISQVAEYHLEISNKNIDIGEQLNSLKQTQYKEIYIKVRDGVYIWEQSVYIFDNCFLKIYAENKERVTIFMKDPTIHRLIMDGRNSTVQIVGIDIYESICTPHSTDIVDLSGHNMTFALIDGTIRLSSSPFVCLKKTGIKSVMLENVNIVKDISAITDVTMVQTDADSGIKGFVFCKNATVGEGCSLGKQARNLEIIQ